jgi:hypothetical protein
MQSKMVTVLALAWACAPVVRAADVLFVADEIPAMEVLSKQFQSKAHVTTEIVQQTAMPAALAPYPAVVVYIHKDIDPAAEAAFLTYLRGGGKLILIHHSISSGKRKNKEWLPAFEITLPMGKTEDGGYFYADPATFEVINVAPGNPITTRGVTYDHKVKYASGGEGAEKEYGAFTAADTEIYLNHRFDGPRTKLLGLKWTDPKSGRTYQQDTVGWEKKVGEGTVFYFMVGHKAGDFEIPAYAQILTNALMAENTKPQMHTDEHR